VGKNLITAENRMSSGKRILKKPTALLIANFKRKEKKQEGKGKNGPKTGHGNNYGRGLQLAG